MVDFAKIRSMSPQERDEFLARGQNARYDAEDVQRDKDSVKAITLKLEYEPESRMLHNGDRVVLFRGFQPGQTSPSLAVYTIPARIEADDKLSRDFDKGLIALGGGDELSFAGKWSARNWKDQQGNQRKSWEFKAQHFQEGNLSLEKIMEKVIADRGMSADAGVEKPAEVQAKRGIRANVLGNNGIGD